MISFSILCSDPFSLQELFQEYVVSNESHTVCRMEGCDKDYRDRKCLVRHIGSTHNKVSPTPILDYLAPVDFVMQEYLKS